MWIIDDKSSVALKKELHYDRRWRLSMMLSDNQERLLRYLKKVALEIGEAGRSLTDIIGELSACKLLGLTWQPSQGYDALGSREERIQIKTRKSWSTEEVNPRGSVGRFGRKGKYDFDRGIYVELNKNFEVKQIWQLPKKEIMALEAKKTKGKGLHVYECRNLGDTIYP